MNIGGIGAGAMGSGIAQVAAQAGHAVVVYDTRKEALNHCQAQLKKTFDRLVEKGRVSATEAQEIVSRVAYSDSLAPMRGCGLVIEAIIEKPDAKKSVFEALETLVAPDAILATNTSSLSIAVLTAGFKAPRALFGHPLLQSGTPHAPSGNHSRRGHPPRGQQPRNEPHPIMGKNNRGMQRHPGVHR